MAEERERLMEAMADQVAAVGYEATSVAEVCRIAGVEEEEFEHEFGDKQGCFMAVYRRNNERFGAPIFAAFERGLSWRDSLRSAAYAAARFLRDHPREVAYNVTATLQAGALVQAERDAFLQSIIDLVDRGRQELEDPNSVGRHVAEGVMGSIYGTLVKQMQEGGGATKSAEEFVPELMYIAVRPYLGHEVAKEELEIPPPPE